MSRSLYRLGRFAARRPVVTIAAWLAVAIAVVSMSAAFGRQMEDSMAVPGLDSQQAIDLLDAAGAADAGLTAQVVVAPTAGTFADDGAASRALDDVRDRLTAVPNVFAVTEPSISPDGRVALLRVQYPVMERLDATDLERLTATVDELRSENTAVEIESGGDLYFAFSEPETGLGEMAGILAAMVILLVAFGSLIAMGLPIGLAVFGLALGVSAMPLVSYLIEIPSWAPMMAGMVGLGVGIDYALLLVTRHREHLAAGMAVDEAAGRAVATAGSSVVFAGGTVVVSILGLTVAGIPFVTAAGVAVSVVVLLMVTASITLLPAFLGLAGHWINRLGIHRRHHVPRREPGARWERWGAHVSRHAVAYLLGVTLLLLGLTAPVLALQLGVPDEGTLPESRTERRAYDLVADGFGPGVNGPLVIAVDSSRDDSVVDPLAAAVADDPGIASVVPAVVDPEAGVASIVAIPVSAPQDDATYETVDRLRNDVIPAVLGSSPATAHVGGQTAAFADLSQRVADRLFWFIGAVVVLSFLLLTVVFRSLLVPLKAAILNLLSIGAAYGVMVMVFQWEWGASLIGLESSVPIVSFIPMFMFAIVFGLSMDYEVFLLSRVREHYLATGDNDGSVIHGLASTARVITSAALIMVSVFLGFVTSGDPTTKMFGLGLATAILVDATVVRMVLVPATMKLMGDANWWLPGWLDRLLPVVDLDGAPSTDAAPPVADAEPEPVLVGSC